MDDEYVKWLPLKTVSVYATISVLWILLSDIFLGIVLQDKALLMEVAIAKDSLYVFTMSILLYYIVRYMLRNIAVSKQAEDALRVSEEQYRTLVENSPDCIFIQTGQRFAYLNPAACAMFGAQSPDELIGTPILDRVSPASHDLVSKRISLLNDERQAVPSIEVQYRRLDGTCFDAEVQAVPYNHNGKNGALAFFRDISRRKKAENDASHERELSRQILDSIPNPAFLISKERQVKAVNQAAMRFGAKVGDYCWCSIFACETVTAVPLTGNSDDIMSQQETRCFFCLADEVMETRRSLSKEVELEGTIWETWWVPVDDDTFLHYAIDITERKRTEQELERNKNLMDAVLESIDDGIVACDKDGFITVFNRATRNFHGLSEKRMPPEQWAEYYSIFEPDGITPMKPDQVPLFKALHGIEVTNQEMVIAPDNSPAFTVLATGRQLVDRNGIRIGAVVTMNNISTQKALEDRLRQSQKMESIGTLAGGVAHDFNNILTVIMGCCTMLTMKIKNDSGLEPFVKQILDSSERAAKLTQGLLAFSRKQSIKPFPADINDIILSIKSFLERILDEDIRLETILAPGPLQVSVDKGQIEQVLMNLAVNARDAMPNGGLLRIETSLIDSDEIAKDLEDVEFDSYVHITVTDTGTGIDKTIMDKIFEPFFTTKETGRGTGLGLSMAYGIIKQHHGLLKVSSEPGKGSVFSIYLPVKQAGKEVAPGENELFLPVGNEMLLLVEDDDEVRSINGNILTNVGYNVLLASNGEEALHLFEQHQDTIALVILDIIMPGMNGRELHDRLILIRPQVKVLFASGYSADYLLQKGVVPEDVNFMSKPFLPHVLLSKVRDLIDK